MRYLPAFLFIIISCGSPERGPNLKRERGLVVAMQYEAPMDGSGNTTTYNSKGGVGFGHTTIHTDEKYMVVFRCEHSVVFSINSMELYAKLDERDSVIIEYYELIEYKKVVDFDFVDANKIK